MALILAEPICYLVARIYGQHMEKDKALERRFQQVFIKQPNVEDTVSFRLAEVSKGLIEFCANASTTPMFLGGVASFAPHEVYCLAISDMPYDATMALNGVMFHGLEHNTCDVPYFFIARYLIFTNIRVHFGSYYHSR